jgi:hypothetical protein
MNSAATFAKVRAHLERLFEKADTPGTSDSNDGKLTRIEFQHRLENAGGRGKVLRLNMLEAALLSASFVLKPTCLRDPTTNVQKSFSLNNLFVR